MYKFPKPRINAHSFIYYFAKIIAVLIGGAIGFMLGIAAGNADIPLLSFMILIVALVISLTEID